MHCNAGDDEHSQSETTTIILEEKKGKRLSKTAQE
jgi:hypothetical protein